MRARPFLFAIALLGCFAVAATASAQASGVAGETLTNKSVIAMAAGGLPDEVIIAKIEGSTVDFDLSTNGLMDLMQGKVSSAVIKAMLAQRAKLLSQRSAQPTGAPAQAGFPAATPTSVNLSPPAVTPPTVATSTPPSAAQAQATPPPAPTSPPVAAQPAAASVQGAVPSAAAAAPASGAPAPGAPTGQLSSQAALPQQPAAADPNEPVLPSEPGIWLLSEMKGSRPSYQMVEPTVFTRKNVGGIVGSLKGVATAGIASADRKAVVKGSTAVASTTEKNPSFIFVFDLLPAGANAAGPTFGTVTRPNEFSLIAMDAVPNGREAVLYATNSWGSQSGAQTAKGAFDLVFARLKAGVYRVTVKSALPPGEYCFVVLAKDAAAMTKLWDFAVR
jgi:hypothetical protein